MNDNYSLYKRVIQQTPISKTYNCLNKATNQVWKAKVFNLQKLCQYSMQQVIEYNEQVLNFTSKQTQNVIHLQKILTKQNSQILILQIFNERLSNYLNYDQNKNGIQNKNQVKKILQDIFNSICDVYKEDYTILNLRTEHIVQVVNQGQINKKWKIQSFVFDYSQFNLPQKCQYQFDYQWASNQEKKMKQKIPENLKDQQLVWYVGIIAIKLVLGNQFKLKQTFNDSDLNMKKIKQKCLPEVYQLIEQSVKANQKDRISLKKFLQLKIFQQLYLSKSIKQKFTLCLQSRILKSSILKSSIIKKSQIRKQNILNSKISHQLPSKINKNQTLNNLTQKQAYDIYNNLRIKLQIPFYLAQIKNYTQTNALFKYFTDQDKILIRLIYFKFAQIYLSLIKKQLFQSESNKKFRQSKNSIQYFKILSNKINQNQISTQKSINVCIKNYSQRLLKINPNNLNVLKMFKKQLEQLKAFFSKKQSYQKSFIILKQSFKLFSGKFYSLLKKQMDSKNQDQNDFIDIKKKSLCYFPLCSYLICIIYSLKDQNLLWSTLKTDFKSYFQKINKKREKQQQNVKYNQKQNFPYFINFCEYTQKLDVNDLINDSQNIINKYFQVEVINNKDIKNTNQKSNRKIY